MTGPSKSSAGRSPLDALIKPEIAADRLWRWISRVAATPGVEVMLEIGSSSGDGSTEAFVAGARRNPRRPTLHCVELSRARFAALDARWGSEERVACHNISSVPAEAFPTPEEIDAFRRRVWTRFRLIPRAKVMAWLRADLAYLEREGMSEWGIRKIRAEHGIDTFDAVLIDGSEFAGPAELEEVHGAGYLLLDDVRTFKNHGNVRRLLRDPAYRLLERSRRPRNGFAIFARRDRPDPVSWEAT